MQDFLRCFVPLFIAVDAIGVLPIFLNLTEEMGRPQVKSVTLQSVGTAAAVALLFLALGRILLNYLGVSVADFLVAGGTLLFVLSLSDLLTAEKERRKVAIEAVGAVPLGVPLIAGPAVLTTGLLLLDTYGPVPTVAATVLNIGIAGVVFWYSRLINSVLGKTGSRILSKLASLLLAAIAVKMVRQGVVDILAGVAS
jgi:multiple antibiotic resistance protein